MEGWFWTVTKRLVYYRPKVLPRKLRHSIQFLYFKVCPIRRCQERSIDRSIISDRRLIIIQKTSNETECKSRHYVNLYMSHVSDLQVDQLVLFTFQNTTLIMIVASLFFHSCVWYEPDNLSSFAQWLAGKFLDWCICIDRQILWFSSQRFLEKSDMIWPIFSLMCRENNQR